MAEYTPSKQEKDYADKLRQAVDESRDALAKTTALLANLMTEPLTFGTLIRVHKYVDPSLFAENQDIVVIDRESPHHRRTGVIFKLHDNAPIVDSNNRVYVRLSNGESALLSIGVEGGDPAQLRLVSAPDGTYAVIAVDGKQWEVRSLPNLEMVIGQTVKVHSKSLAIVGLGDCNFSGPTADVVTVHEVGVEVRSKSGELYLVSNPAKLEIEEGDHVACDPSMLVITNKLAQANDSRYGVKVNDRMTWSDIGGLENVKKAVKDAIELPFKNPEMVKHYGIEPCRGLLLYGPPGCGKTMFARMAANSIAKMHGKESASTGYLYVKSPEIMNMWLGNSEKEVRYLFERARKHYRKHGYKAVLVFDEADAIMGHRNRPNNSDSDFGASTFSATIVGMLLGEMDGADIQKTQENPIVFLLTNRPESIDPAILRPGRIDQTIKVPRPNEDGVIDILSLHAKNAPMADKDSFRKFMAITGMDIMSKSRTLMRINHELDFNLSDVINGAMLKSIIDKAKVNAAHRDIEEGKFSGITLPDLHAAVETIFESQKGLHPTYDLMDFCDEKGLNYKDVRIDNV